MVITVHTGEKKKRRAVFSCVWFFLCFVIFYIQDGRFWIELGVWNIYMMSWRRNVVVKMGQYMTWRQKRSTKKVTLFVITKWGSRRDIGKEGDYDNKILMINNFCYYHWPTRGSKNGIPEKLTLHTKNHHFVDLCTTRVTFKYYFFIRPLLPY